MVKKAGSCLLTPCLCSSFDRLARFDLDDFHFRVTAPDLVFKPFFRFYFPMTENDCARFDLPDKVQQILPVRVGSEIKFLDVTFPRDFTR